MNHLRELQRRFQAYLVDGDEAITADIGSSADALAEHRLGVYYNAFRLRLIDALALDYAALESILGRESFENLALDYLRRYPSRHPSIRWFGQHLPRYLREDYAGEDAEFLAEMAAWEWEQTLVFDAADGEDGIGLEDMARVAPEAWAGLRFEFQPALRSIDLHWNIPPLRYALVNDENPPARIRDEYPVRWALWRQETKTRWRSLAPHEAWAIEQAAAGADFAGICEGMLEWIDAEQAPLAAASLVKQWIGDQLVTRLVG